MPEDFENQLIKITNAGFFRRFFAFFIDHLILLCFLILLFDKFINNMSELIYITMNITNFKFGLIISIIILFFEIYFAIFEWLWNGQTPGKWLCGLRVVMNNGEKVGFFPSIVRNLLRCTFFIPPFILIPDVICLIISPDNKRIGDYLAGTRVIRNQHVNNAEILPETKDN